MRYGIREIANVMLKAKADNQVVGNRSFSKGQPVCHFTTLKTSTIEGAATTVYAQGGRGNSRLLAWEGERTLTMTMEDALISPMGLAILTGAGLIDATEKNKITTHYTENFTLAKGASTLEVTGKNLQESGTEAWMCMLDEEGNPIGEFMKVTTTKASSDGKATVFTIPAFKNLSTLVAEGETHYLLDYYGSVTTNATQIDIEPGRFGGYFYLEAETLVRQETTGKDVAAEFIIPHCKVQSNFTFSMASSGDPSTFTFTIDAFPGIIKGGDKKVLCAIQILESEYVDEEYVEPAII